MPTGLPRMKITCLVENTAIDRSMIAEHGLSIYIQTDRHNILLDMGQSDAFLQNAQRLGVDLKTVDLAVLSHGHYDHGGGLAHFLTQNKTATVYVQNRAFKNYTNARKMPIGLDGQLLHHPQIRLLSGDHIIDDEVSILSYPLDERAILGDYYELSEGIYLPDRFLHEQYLCIRKHNAKVLFSGCTHVGALPILQYFTPDYLIGGLHLSKCPLDRRLDEYAQALANYPTKIITCHCTGIEQTHRLQRHLPTLQYLHGGQTIELSL